jgi:hypothetical protein
MTEDSRWTLLEEEEEEEIQHDSFIDDPIFAWDCACIRHAISMSDVDISLAILILGQNLHRV